MLAWQLCLVRQQVPVSGALGSSHITSCTQKRNDSQGKSSGNHHLCLALGRALDKVLTEAEANIVNRPAVETGPPGPPWRLLEP